MSINNGFFIYRLVYKEKPKRTLNNPNAADASENSKNPAFGKPGFEVEGDPFDCFAAAVEVAAAGPILLLQAGVAVS